jgi:hypothetical protein
MPIPTSRPWRRLMLPLAVLGVLGLAACGQADVAAADSSESTTADSAVPAAGDRAGQRRPAGRHGRACPGRAAERYRDRRWNGASARRRAARRAAAAGSPRDGAAPGASGLCADGTPPAPPGVDAGAWQAALRACADLVPGTSRPVDAQPVHREDPAPAQPGRAPSLAWPR